MIFKHVKGSGTKKFEKHWFQRKEGLSCAGTYTGLPPSALAKTQAQYVSNLASYFGHMAYPASGHGWSLCPTPTVSKVIVDVTLEQWFSIRHHFVLPGIFGNV